jgi:hypothetical protein
MMGRQRLLELKKAARRKTSGMELGIQEMHALIDHGLECLDKIDGGQTAAERDKQLGLALADLRGVLHEILDNVPVDLKPAVADAEPLLRDIQKGVYTLDCIEEMLKAKGPQWKRQWADYVPRIEEEFGD